jgi:hypothetical protein
MRAGSTLSAADLQIQGVSPTANELSLWRVRLESSNAVPSQARIDEPLMTEREPLPQILCNLRVMFHSGTVA